MWVGLPTVLTILGNQVARSLLDWYLAKTSVKGQQSPDHDPPGGKSNTWEPVYGAEVQAHGSFDEQAYAHSLELQGRSARGACGDRGGRRHDAHGEQRPVLAHPQLEGGA